MHTLRRSVFPFVFAAGLALIAGAAVMSVPTPVAAATTGAGFPGITPYGGYLGNYIAPDGTRVYCIDADLEWPSGTTSEGAVVDALATSWGAPVATETLQKFNYALARYGQTADPVLAAAVSAYVYAYTSGYAHTHGPGYEAGRHYIGSNAAVLATYNALWDETENFFAAAPEPTAEIAIDMTEPLAGSVVVTTSPEGAAGTLILDGAVVSDSSETTIEVSGGERVAITGAPGSAVDSYTIAATASFRVSSGYGPLVTLYTTGSQQRTIRDAGLAQVDFASSARVDVELPPPAPTPTPTPTPAALLPEVPTLAATGSELTPALGMLGAGIALVAVGALAPLLRRSREYVAASRVVPQRE